MERDKTLPEYYNLIIGKINTETGTSTQPWAEVGEIIVELATSRLLCPEVDLGYNHNQQEDLA